MPPIARGEPSRSPPGPSTETAIVPGGLFVSRVYVLRPDTPHKCYTTDSLDNQVTPGSATGERSTWVAAPLPPAPSCQVSVSVWNYDLTDNVDSNAPVLVIGDGTAVMTV